MGPPPLRSTDVLKRKLPGEHLPGSPGPTSMGPPTLPRTMSSDIGSPRPRQGSLPPFAQQHRQPSLPPQIKHAPSSTQLIPTTASPLAQPPPLPANAQPNSAITRVTTVPLLTSLQTIPPLDPSEIANIRSWIQTDTQYEAIYRASKERSKEELRAVFQGSPAAPPTALGWWEKPGTANFSKWRRQPEQFGLRFPRTKPSRDSNRPRKGGRREGIRLPRHIKPEDANRQEMLVPIRIEFDVDPHKMRETFVWNLNDPVVTPEMFAQSLVEDYALPGSYLVVISKSIHEQLADYKSHLLGFDPDTNQFINGFVDVANDAAPLKGNLDSKEAEWWEKWRRRLKALEDSPTPTTSTDRPRVNGSSSKTRKRKAIKEEEDVDMFAGDEMDEEDYRPMGIDEFKLDEQNLHEDMRILIKLDIIVGSVKLDDQFEWDLDNPGASAEEFADVYTSELGLGGEFKTAIAHSIREQVQTYQKSLFLVGHPSDGTPVQDEELKQAFLPSLASGARSVSEVQNFTPLLNYLSDGELERNEKEREKDMNKRRKRNTRGRRGVALPDREPIRTYRTPAIGFPELDPATLAAVTASNQPTSRRAAAAAAQLTITNIVISENSTSPTLGHTPIMPNQSIMPSAPTPAPVQPVPKEKKQKGLFKAPSYPSSVLLPRANVVAPTPSTALDSSKATVPADNEAPRSASIQPPPPPPDSKAAKVVTARRAKELEREAKEKEFVDNQHPNLINGIWHCSNCGCPESIAVGRRKGPLGDKSQCGPCGKYWHRHRRPRPVEYNSDINFHSGQKQKEIEATTKPPMSKKKGGAAALRALSAAHSTPAADHSEPPTPARNGDVADTPAPVSSRKGNHSAKMAAAAAAAKDDEDEDERPMSPVSSASSASEAPLAQKVKINGSNSHAKSASTSAAPSEKQPPLPPATPVKNEKAESARLETPAAPAAAPSATTTSSPAAKTWPPQWLTAAMQAMQAKYPNDRFEAILRRVPNALPDWRIKCLDCPGKLYTPGPNETLANYEVHLKNRQHRQRVNERLASATAAAGASKS